LVKGGGKVGRATASLTRRDGEKDVLLNEVRKGAAVVDPVRVTFAGWRSGFEVGGQLEASLKYLEVVEQGDGKGVGADYTREMVGHVQAHEKWEGQRKSPDTG
jgi:hypothetical protein